MAWKIVSGPREYETTDTPADVAFGWTWEIERQGVRRLINADISGDAEDRYAYEDAEEAVRDVLGEDQPPVRLMLTSTGVHRA